MATTPNASPSTANVTGTGTTATTSTINITANSAATLAAAQAAIKQATGNAPPNTFAVGSTTNVSQAAPGGKFVQGSVTTPRLNAAAAASPPPTNNGVSSSISVQNILGLAALAGAGLSVFNNVFGGTNLSQTLVNNSNTATPATSTNNVQDPAETARLARQNAAVTPSTNSTNNVQDPAETARLARQNADVATSDTNTTLSDAETSQLFAVEEDPFPNSETTVLSDEEAAKIFAQIDEEAIENESPASQLVAVDEDPFIENESPVDTGQDDATGVDEAIAERKFEDSFVDDATGVDEAIAEQKFEDSFVDDATGVDEAIAYQKDLEDGSLEFAGIDEQIADNENGLQEPPLLSDEEIDQQLQAAQDENIENQDPRQPSDEEVDAAIAASREEEIVDQKSAEVDELSAYPPYETPPTEEPEAVNPQAAAAQSGFNGATGDERNTQSQATQQDVSNFAAKPDWRVRLSLSPGATYLYKANPPGILAPLQATDGVIFPYTPAISVSYNASYDPTDLTHSNYKFFTYKNSAVDSITIGCDFTAQDTAEAQYLLAVIHFFRSATKMFYGQDQNPKNGTPPPLCYLSGLGAFQFDAHPLAITGFTYTLPTDVDYIKAGSTATPGGVNRGNSPMQGKPGESIMAQASASRMSSSGINPGAVSAPPNWQQDTGTKEPTYVPTKINLSITAVPIVTRNDISNKFSLKDYATGALLRGTRRAGGGIW